MPDADWRDRVKRILSSLDISVGTVLVSLLAATLAYDAASSQAVRNRKLAVLDEISGHRYLLHPFCLSCRPLDPLLEALNRAIVTYAEHPEVVDAITAMENQDLTLEQVQDCLDSSIVKMAAAIEIKTPELDERKDLPGLVVECCPGSGSQNLNPPTVELPKACHMPNGVGM